MSDLASWAQWCANLARQAAWPQSLIQSSRHTPRAEPAHGVCGLQWLLLLLCCAGLAGCRPGEQDAPAKQETPAPDHRLWVEAIRRNAVPSDCPPPLVEAVRRVQQREGKALFDKQGSLLGFDLAVTEAALAPLAQCHKLSTLVLRELMMDDAVVDRLKHLTGLRRLELRQTALSADGLKRLHETLPGCTITADASL